jgi:predicted transposase/invertase (TIGR01784 family)
MIEANTLKKAEDKGRDQGRAEGRAEGKYEVAKNMLSADSDISFISKVTGLSIAEINKLLKP